MPDYLYDVTMNTPLGERRGVLRLTALEGSTSGSLMLLGISHPILGSISPDGVCHLTGTLQTLIHRLPFRAEGRISPPKVDMLLVCEHRTYPISGKRRDG